MEVNKAIFNYYEEEISKVKTPVLPILNKVNDGPRERIYNIIFAAAITLVCITVFTNITLQSSLSIKAEEFSEYHNLDTVIPAGLLEINIFVSESLISGGK